MRDESEKAEYTNARNTTIVNILSDPSNARGINTWQMAYFNIMLPEYIEDYAVDIQPKTEPAPSLIFIPPFTNNQYDPVKLDANAEIVKTATGLEYIYDGTETWVKQSDILDCYFQRNNYFRYMTRAFSIYSSIGEISYESIRTTIITTWNTETQSYESETTVNNYNGVLISNLNGPRNEAVPSRFKRSSYNFELGEYYTTTDINQTVELKLNLTDGTDDPNYKGVDWVEWVKLVYNYVETYREVSGGPVISTFTYDYNATQLTNGEFVDLPEIEDFIPDWSQGGYSYSKSFDGTRSVYSFKEFETYQDVVDLVLQ